VLRFEPQQLYNSVLVWDASPVQTAISTKKFFLVFLTKIYVSMTPIINTIHR